MAVREYGVWSKLTGWAGEDKTRGRERTEISDEDQSTGKGESRQTKGISRTQNWQELVNDQMGNEGEESDGYPKIGCDLHIADSEPKSLKNILEEEVKISDFNIFELMQGIQEKIIYNILGIHREFRSQDSFQKI